ncbi:MAG TPA: Cof-type HAD-IIB family hydrolase [Clostridiaceae bacterium]|nr:Cof-type HAD-IIB family hydrolase [Clostridiaceae bacterium]
MKYDSVVIYSDLDGTLLNKERKISQENLDAISRFVSLGGSFAVATGRMERTTLINFPSLKINAPSIFFNGAMAYDLNSQEVLFSTFMPDGLDPVLQDIMRRYPTVCVVVNARGKGYVFNENEIIRSQIKKEGLEKVVGSWDDLPGNWIKVVFGDKHEILEKIKADLDGMGRSDISITFSEHELLDVMASGVSKGAALKKLKDLYKDKWKLTVAVGDNDNDYEMMQQADIAIAVSNATEKVKSAADHVIAHHDIPCMPRVLEILDEHLRNSV